jgi:hypothetical protein
MRSFNLSSVYLRKRMSIYARSPFLATSPPYLAHLGPAQLNLQLPLYSLNKYELASSNRNAAYSLQLFQYLAAGEGELDKWILPSLRTYGSVLIPPLMADGIPVEDAEWGRDYETLNLHFACCSRTAGFSCIV